MRDAAVQLREVSKKFRRGELFDSLRDLVPALTGRLFRRRASDSLGSEEFWALRDVSFEVARGEAYGVIGSNGAGKSTILKLLTGIMRPTLGAVRVNGRLSALIEVSAGFHPDLTGRENIYLNGTILGMTRAEIRQRFDEIVAFSGLEEFIDTPVKRYSSGMFARLGFSVAAHVDPDILLVDEVLSVGDVAFQQRSFERMRQIIGRGATVVLVSHNLRAVAELCTRAVLLHRGTISATGTAEDVIRLYLDSFTRAHASHPDSPVAIERVEIEGGGGSEMTFSTGSRATVNVTFRAQRRVKNVAVVIHVQNQQFIDVFDTSSERLGSGSVTLEAGESATCAFELDLHLAPGTYHVSAWLHRYDTSAEFDHWEGARTFFVSSDIGARGIAQLYPKARFLQPPA